MRKRGALHRGSEQERSGNSLLLNHYLRLILAAKVYDLAQVTPLDPMPLLSKTTKRKIWLKREDKQPGFSFKIRGAANKFSQLSSSYRMRGVVAASAGNHAQGVAMAAKCYGAKAIIVMPVTTPAIKVEATRSLGAEVKLYGDCYDDAQAYARMIAVKRGMVFIHPFDDPDVIAGQGTVGLEMVTQLPHAPEAVFVPVGGGGLIAGIGVYIKSVWPHVRVIGVEPEGAQSLRTALKAGKRVTMHTIDLFADGVAVKQVGKENFRLAQHCVDQVILVSSAQIAAAVKTIFEETRTIVEPAGALALAGLLRYIKTYPQGAGE